ncbi:MAG: peptidoglycan editing factor PgeF [Clostridia bacterium]|nr:peptidoglycan editing factor PgeF [Clostridia bacterium]
MPSLVREKKDNIIYWRVAFLEKRAPVKAVFSGRSGGSSRPPYASLNLGLHVGDDPAAVMFNRRLVAESLNLPLQNWVIGEQVHANRVARVGYQHAGRGVFEPATAVNGVDALVTAEPQLVLVAFYADCVPLYLVDPRRRVIGLAHAGWKGSVLRIGSRVVNRMVKEFNCQPADLLAFIGPAVGSCCYQVDNRVGQAVKNNLPWAEKVLTSDGPHHFRLDLPHTNYLDLLAAGLQPEHIGLASICTCCHADSFFSYRAAAGVTGRQAAILSLE